MSKKTFLDGAVGGVSRPSPSPLDDLEKERVRRNGVRGAHAGRAGTEPIMMGQA